MERKRTPTDPTSSSEALEIAAQLVDAKRPDLTDNARMQLALDMAPYVRLLNNNAAQNAKNAGFPVITTSLETDLRELED